jgi:hypothetical protein
VRFGRERALAEEPSLLLRLFLVEELMLGDDAPRRRRMGFCVLLGALLTTTPALSQDPLPPGPKARAPQAAPQPKKAPEAQPGAASDAPATEEATQETAATTEPAAPESNEDKTPPALTRLLAAAEPFLIELPKGREAKIGTIVELWRPVEVAGDGAGAIADRIRLGRLRIAALGERSALALRDGELLAKPAAGDVVVWPEESAPPAVATEDESAKSNTARDAKPAADKALAPPPTSPAVVEPSRREGGFFRFGVGPAVMGMRYTAFRNLALDQSEQTIDHRAVALSAELLGGGAPVPGLVLAARAGIFVIPGLELDYDELMVTADMSTMVMPHIGGMIDWYPNPNGGWHLFGSAGFSAASVTITDLGTNTEISSTDLTGPMFGGGFGYEGFLADEFSVGFQLRLDVLKLTGDDPLFEDKEVELDVFAPALGMTITYN